MISFIIGNIGTIIVSLVLIAIVALAVVSMIRDKKKGKSCTCGGSCSGCAMSGRCHGK